MPEDGLKKIRQYCVSVAVLLLTLFAVYTVQSTLDEVVQASAKEQKGPEPEQFLQMGETLPVGGHGGEKPLATPWSRIFGTNPPEIVRQQGAYCVLIKKNGAVLKDIAEEMIYRRLTLTLEGEGLTGEQIYRVCGDALYTGAPKVEELIIPEELKNVPLNREPSYPEEDVLLDLAVTAENGKETVVMEFHTVYEVTVTEDEEFVYLSLIRPMDKYDKIVVIDPGHGGIDPGTRGGGSTEAAVNLAVARYLKEMLDAQEEWRVYYTRLDNSLPDLSTRVEFANALHADMLISIHCNYNPVSAVNGVETMYSRVQGVGDPLNSELLAQLCTQYVSEETGLKARDLVERSKNLHIIKYCKMPMALVEFGFMSNRKDLSIILKEESQRGCARAIYKTIEEAYTYLEKETTGE